MQTYKNKRSIKNIDVSGKTVLLRCDFNVPMNQDGSIANSKRIDETLPTINYILNKNAKVVLCSHLGKPKGQYKKELSLAPVAKYLSQLLKKQVRLIEEIISTNAKDIINSLAPGEICLLENLRFWPEEETNDIQFSQKLASLADIYVNDAFGTCHRSHTSTVGVTSYIPSAYGLLIEKELETIDGLLENPARPLVAILGGSKVSDKINLINSLLNKVDCIIIGGGMSYTFINALGYCVGTSLCETEKITLAKDIMANAKEKNVKIFLPLDFKIAKEFSANAETKIVDSDKIPEGWMGLDIGPKTIKLFQEIISDAKTVLWNGPVGVFEWENFETGTREVAQAIAKSDCNSIVGGGDSASAIEKFGLEEKITHISTGGGAFLHLLEGKPLPALQALSE